jgi:signal transduction histidine kinase
MSSEQFTVDTHLFRELGSLLVGRDSTALIELIKNAYDADATKVVVYGDSLDKPNIGRIIVTDNGNGMTAQRFRNSFLRIASRSKDTPQPISPRFKRRYTGSKGIGRLAAHKLASILEIESVARDIRTGKSVEAFKASINWDLIESSEILSEVDESAVTLKSFTPNPSAKSGTTITLRKLRKKWSEREKLSFVTEARSTQPIDFLVKPPNKNILSKPLLFEEPLIVSESSTNNEWNILLEGDFLVGDDYSTQAIASAAWILEIDASKFPIRFGIAPTNRYAEHNKFARRIVRPTERISQTNKIPFFHSRIAIREGDWHGSPGAAKSWRDSKASGVRVYMEGFRVLPYGEPGNDWLRLDRQYAERSRAGTGASELTSGLFDVDESEDGNTYLKALPAKSYLGGAFLTIEKSGDLEMLVNREGFIPSSSFFHLEETLRAAIDFAIIVRAEAKDLFNADKVKNENKGSSSSRNARQTGTPTKQLDKIVTESQSLIRQLSNSIAVGDLAKAERLVISVDHHLKNTPDLVSDIRDEQAMIRSLASLGTHFAGFVHELRGLLATTSVAEKTLRKLHKELQDVPIKQKSELFRAIEILEGVRLGLERQAVYVGDFTSSDSRRRRRTHSLREIFEKSLEVFSVAIERLGTTAINDIAEGVTTPKMFRAELLSVLSNVLSNALKAAGRNGRIRATAELAEDGCVFKLENTGAAVDYEHSERWFRPFATKARDVDPSLGKGMGLGLTITRRILDEYGWLIRFIKPRKPYTTAVEINFRG